MVQMAKSDTTAPGGPREVITIMADQDPSREIEFRGTPISSGAMDKWLGVTQGTTRVAKALWLTDQR